MAAVMPVRRHMPPPMFVSAAVDEPPTADRFTVTVEMLLLGSETVHWSVVTAMPLALTLNGVNEQADITGGGSVTTSVATRVPVAFSASVAVISG